MNILTDEDDELLQGVVTQTATAPDFLFEDLVDASIALSVAAGKSPVRYMSLGGDQPRARTGMRWNPSSLNGCNLKAVYKACKVHPDPDLPVDLEQQEVFDRGTVMGAWMAAYIRALEGSYGVTDVQCQCIDREELLVVDKELSYGGFVDIVFKIHGVPYIVEVKSKDNETAFNKILRPDPKQLQQLNDYMAISGIHQGWLVYMGLIDGPRKQRYSKRSFPHAFDPKMWRETRDMIQALDRFRQRPERMPFRSSNPRFECSGCSYQVKCNKGWTPQQALDAQALPAPEEDGSG